MNVLKSQIEFHKKDNKSLSKFKAKFLTQKSAKVTNLIPESCKKASSCMKEKESLRLENEKLKQELRSVRSVQVKERRESQAAIDYHKDLLNDKGEDRKQFAVKKNKKQYSTDVRFLIYEFLFANCQVERIPNLMSRCAEVINIIHFYSNCFSWLIDRDR